MAGPAASLIHSASVRAFPLVLILLVGCGEKLPDDIPGYDTRCVKLNPTEIPPEHSDDPHDGFKNVYACGMTEAEVAARTPGDVWPDGTIIVKESSMPAQDHIWLIATMRKESGAWKWDEYTRNFADDDFLRLPISEDVCIDCHKKVAAIDWVYTQYQAGEP